uniref:Death domain-containing protein n=1 Tax=Amphimedon queenslandica TaxID=400682 RepID=A0A1X7VAZ1_AMPQE
KPKRDELFELLSSSKFIAGTWEQFVCCLPKMTQDMIAGIKERVSKEENIMSAIAQHCFDNNPDITWRNLIDALLDANEVTVARNVLDKHS